MSIWWMHDNHTFEEISLDRDTFLARVSELFDKDPCGSVGFKPPHKGEMIHCKNEKKSFMEAAQEWAKYNLGPCWDVKTILAFCTKNGCTPIAVLRTPRAGENVDNGQGVDFDLCEWALIYKPGKGQEHFHLNHKLHELEGFSIKHDLNLMDHESHIDELIASMKDMDAYEVQWVDINYAEPKLSVKPLLLKTTEETTKTTTKIYEVRIPYPALSNYMEESSRTYCHPYDLLNFILRDTELKYASHKHELFFEEQGLLFKVTVATNDK